MFKELMHSLSGNNLGQGILGNTVTTAGAQSAMIGQQSKRSTSKKIFYGNIEVQQVSNGYVVNIATKEGYEYTTYIAQTIIEVNEIIASAMVAFQLEQ